MLSDGKISSVEMKKFQFKTTRFIVRPLEKQDYLSWLDAYSGFKKKKSKYDQQPYEARECGKKVFMTILKRHKKLANSDQVYVWFIFDKASKEIVGYVDTWVLCRKEIAKANLGYLIFNRHWKKGIATEVLKKAVPFILNELKLNRLEAAIDLDNRPSINLVKKLKFRSEGVRQNYWFQNNQWEDQVVYVVDRKMCKIKALKY